MVCKTIKISVILVFIGIIFYFPTTLRLIKINKTQSSDGLVKKYPFKIYIDNNKIFNGYGKEIFLKGITSNEFRYKKKVYKDIDYLKKKILFFKKNGINLIILYLDIPDTINNRREELVSLAKWADLNNLYILLYPVVNETDNSTTKIVKGVHYGPYDNRLNSLMSYLSGELKSYDNVLYGTGAEPHGVDTFKLFQKQNELINIIRSNDKDAVVVINGTNWGGNLDFYLENPIKENNILYDLHYYAANNKDTLNYDNCVFPKTYLDKMPILYGEFGSFSQKDFGSIEDLYCLELFLDDIKNKKISFSMYTLEENKDIGLYFDADGKEDELSEKGKIFIKHLRYMKNL